MEKYADPNDEPTSALYDQSFEDMDLPVEQWKGIFLSFLLFFPPNDIVLIEYFSMHFVDLVFKEVSNFVPQVLHSPTSETPSS